MRVSASTFGCVPKDTALTMRYIRRFRVCMPSARAVFSEPGSETARQKHLFVSQPQNDFIYTIVCEELGFVGAVGVIALFLLLIWRGCVIALRAPDTFSQLVVVGIIGKVAIQALLNIGVVTACLPNTGISLPFFSYGGTALAMQIMEMGIVLGISRYSRRT